MRIHWNIGAKRKGCHGGISAKGGCCQVGQASFPDISSLTKIPSTHFEKMSVLILLWTSLISPISEFFLSILFVISHLRNKDPVP
jgi:hypothetical protein